MLTISLSPHVHSGVSTRRLMWNVVVAMIPALLIALWVFRLDALWVISLSIATCLLTEWAIDRFLFNRPSTLANGSALITGILLAFNLPSTLPWWIVVIGAFVAIAIGKMSFGGLGCNIWNPALVGRVFLLISFPAAMTTWHPGIPSGVDAVTGSTVHSTGATLLTALNDASLHLGLGDVDLQGLLIGNVNGSLGEVGAVAILIGLVYLLFTRVITWHIPVSILVSAALLSWALGGSPVLDILAGGLLLGAVFMATDYVTSPMTHRGQIIYGVLIGVVTILIRRFGSYPEGVSFAILLGNSITPLLNRYTKPRLFGERRKDKK